MRSAPMLLETRRIPAVVRGSYPWDSASRIVLPWTDSCGGMANDVLGVIRPSCSAPATVIALNVEPGSYVKETAWSWIALLTVAVLAPAYGSLALIRGQLAIARIAPVLGFRPIGVALCGEYAAPTPASTCSTSLCSGADSVSRSVLPGC